MAVYLVSYSREESGLNLPEIEAFLAEEYDSIKVLENVWIVYSELDVEELDAELDELVEEVGTFLLVEMTGDFSMQGLPDEQMEWLDNHFQEE